MKQKLKTSLNLADPERIKNLLNESEQELEKLQPKIDKLEKVTQQLRELKLSKQRLLTLKMSLSALLESSTKSNVLVDKLLEDGVNYQAIETKLLNYTELSTQKSFHPDKAFESAEQILKQKKSLNYEMFKAVVFKGGKASTEEIKAFLVESDIKQPQTGEGFENVPLTEISSRANYLVRKGLLQPLERGSFYATVGWV